MKIIGGSPARKRIVVSLAFGGTAIASFMLAKNSCTPTQPPDVPPIVVDDAAPDAVDATPDTPRCEFVTPRSRQGAARRAPRIVGGKPAAEGSFPFAAALATSSRFQYCGGTVIAGTWVLTAAHCQVEAGDLALVGSVDLTKARAIRITESRIHPSFNSQTLDWDVAVARIEAPAGVAVAPLATGVATLDATAIGWGATSEGGNTTRFLQEVTVPLWDFAKCAAVYPSLTSQQLCAGKVEGGADSCQGDSGGSLLTWDVDHWAQLGIVSWGVGCARPGTPGVYTDVRVEGVREWIAACAK